jgi:hypothetical protein
MRIDEQIINIIAKLFYVIIQDRGAYKHKNSRIVSWYIFFPEISIVSGKIYGCLNTFPLLISTSKYKLDFFQLESK